MVMRISSNFIFAQATRSAGQGVLMSVISWLVLGLVAGFIASMLMNKRGEGVLLDIVLGVIGAVVGGWIFRAIGFAGVSGLNVWSILVAVVGAVVVLAVFHLIKGSVIQT